MTNTNQDIFRLHDILEALRPEIARGNELHAGTKSYAESNRAIIWAACAVGGLLISGAFAFTTIMHSAQEESFAKDITSINQAMKETKSRITVDECVKIKAAE